MKLAVHCEPLVINCTPGWIVAVADGAHAAPAAWLGAAAASGRAMVVAAATAVMMNERVRMPRKRGKRPKLALELPVRTSPARAARSAGARSRTVRTTGAGRVRPPS